MKREHLIIILVVTVVLVVCGCAAGAAIILLPNPFVGGGGGGGGGEDWSKPRQEGQPITPSNNLSVLDLVQGTWYCNQGVAPNWTPGVQIQFLVPDEGNGGSGFFVDSGDTEPMEIKYEVGAAGFLTIELADIAIVSPISYHFYAQFPDMNTMLLYTDETGHENDPPSVFQRVQQ
jgi:hypothetical protein